MKIQELSFIFSAARIAKYQETSQLLSISCWDLYKLNIMLSKSFYPLLTLLEVILRNRLDQQLSNHFQDDNWIINQVDGFMCNQELYYYNASAGKMSLNTYLLTGIKEVSKKLKASGIPVTKNNLIAQQNFGFWVFLFKVKPYKVLRGVPIKIFRMHPKKYGRNEIWKTLMNIKSFRNRLYHNESICFKGNKLSLEEPKYIYDAIILLLMSLEPKLIEHLSDLDEVDDILARFDQLIK